jgi:phi13 family phage major tail protein
MPRVGVEQFTVFKELTDDANGATYDAPYAFTKRLMKISCQPNISTADIPADDQITETDSVIVDYKVVIDLKDLTPSEHALLLGKKLVKGVVTTSKNDSAPYFLISFKSKKSRGSGGGYKYLKYLKVRFQEPKEDYESGGRELKYQTPVLEGTAIPRLYDGEYKREGDDAEPSWVSSTGENWFTQADITVDSTPPTVQTTVPANNATGVAVNVPFVWNFSEAILPETVNKNNFFVIKDSDGSLVAGTLTQNAAKTQITFTPSANLTAATAYRAVVTSGVKDLSGNALANGDVRKFTTA